MRSTYQWLISVALLIGVIVISGCGNSGNTTNSNDVGTPSLQLNVTNPVISALNDTRVLAAQAVGENGDPLPVIWSSSDTDVATVDSSGVVTGLAQGTAVITATAGELSDSVTIVVSIGGISVAGQVRYEDKKYDQNGFTGSTVLKPVRHALVDLLDSDGNILDTISTDASGNYSFITLDTGLTLRVLAQTDLATGFDVAINDLDGSLYAITLPVPLTGSTNLSIDISASSTIAGAFNMLDIFSVGTEFVATFSSTMLPALNVYWRSEISSYGTYYCWPGLTGTFCPEGSGIYIIGGGAMTNDTDEFDDDVLWHEFSHFVEAALGIDDSPGGQHRLTDNDLDLRLAWSEGWGDFFPTAVKSWLLSTGSSVISAAPQTPASQYIDTQGSIASISIDITNPGTCGSGTDCYVYSSSEIAIAKVLWNLTQDFTMSAVWNIYENHLPLVDPEPINLESFWDGWLSLHAPDATELSSLATIFSERSVYYLEDSFEMDDTTDVNRKLVVCASACSEERHYLYRGTDLADVDYIAFDATEGITYTIETLGLSNGADTYLRLFDAAENFLGYENDDRTSNYPCCQGPNDDITLSSIISFTPTSSGLYYVEVSTSPYLGPASGRYGTYALQISQ